MTADPLAPESVLDTLQNLVRIPSINPSLGDPSATGEGDVARFVRDWLEARGIHASLEEVAPRRPNVFAEVGRGSPRLALCAHLDTVSAVGMTIPPFEPTAENGRIYGRGSYDMKGGAAAILAAAHSLHVRPAGGTVLLALVADEEYASLGAADFVKRHSAEAAILTEASEGKLIIAHKGFAWISVHTRGRAAHGSRWDLGISAIARMGRIIAALEVFDQEVLRRREHPLVGPASQHCALVEGGVGLTTYAPECSLQVERRMLPGETPEEVLAEIRAVVAECGEEAEVTLSLARPPLVCDPDAQVARAVRAATTKVHGTPAPDAGVAYWMDAAIFAEAGIPTVNYGPSGAGAHEAIEWVDADSVVACARILDEAARLFVEMAR
jgi:acetylornithine deacetylase